MIITGDDMDIAYVITHFDEIASDGQRVSELIESVRNVLNDEEYKAARKRMEEIEDLTTAKYVRLFLFKELLFGLVMRFFNAGLADEMPEQHRDDWWTRPTLNNEVDAVIDNYFNRVKGHAKGIEELSLELAGQWNEHLGSRDLGSFIALALSFKERMGSNDFGISPEDFESFLKEKKGDIKSKTRTLNTLDDALKRISCYCALRGLDKKEFIQRQIKKTGRSVFEDLELFSRRVDVLQDSIEKNEDFIDPIN